MSKIKMAQNLVLSPNNSVNKTRNAILRIKNCSPKFRDVLRQRCKERIYQDRTKLVDRFRNLGCNNDVKHVLSSILVEEWTSMDCSVENVLITPELLKYPEINIDEALASEEDFRKELLAENEEWLMKEYEALLLEEELNENETVTCPLCKKGTFQVQQSFNDRRVVCTNCDKSFRTYKSLENIHKDIHDNFCLHNSHCNFDPEFGAVFENEVKEHLIIICEECSFVSIIL